MTKNSLFSSIKGLGWSAIQLTQKGYRGAVQVYKSNKGDKVPIMFYIDEAFIVEDKDGLFGVQDLVAGLIKEKTIDLDATGCITGLSLISFKNSDGSVSFREDVLDRLNINNTEIKKDIENRLNAVYQLGEMEDVDLGY